MKIKKCYNWLLVVSIAFITACGSSSDTTQEVTETERSLTQADALEQNIIVGERIDGPANIRKGLNGKLLFSLNDKAEVETGPLENDWYPIGIWVDVAQDVNGPSIIKSGAKITQNGVEVGQAIDMVEVWLTEGDKGFIGGQTHKGNIVPETIPELYLSSLLKSGNMTKADFKPFMDALKFEEDRSWNREDINAYFMYEAFIVDPSPMDRISLLFKGENLAAINHSRPLDLPSFKSFKLDRGYELTIVDGMSDEEIATLVEERNKWLGTVD